MKTLFSLLLCLSIFQINASDHNDSGNVYQQLIGLNKYWSAKEAPAINSDKQLDEKTLIQTHLLLVVENLESKTVEHLSKKQQKKRKIALLDLTEYALNGVFPINTYHYKRTPYFIDDLGTACAVGQLIIESGHESLALKVSNESNYQYIENMAYPELDVWANEHGFTKKELMWIQPGYGPNCMPGQVKQPFCNSGMGATGCFNPDWQADNLIQPLSYLSEYNDGSGWNVDTNNSWQFWGANPGMHKITITDSTGRSVVYNYTITLPPPIQSNDSVQQHSSTQTSCNGKLRVNPTQGLAPYTIQLMNQSLNYFGSSPQGVFDSLCPGTYTIVMYDANNCQRVDSALIAISTGLVSLNDNTTLDILNPFSNELRLKTSLAGKKEIQVLDLNGRVIYESEFSSNQYEKDVNLKSGTYILRISVGDVMIQKKIIRLD